MNPNFFESFDLTKLAYFYLPAEQEKAVLLFLPCGGGHINQNYIQMGAQLAQYGVSSYLLDPRGHGLSDGRRGDTPSAEYIFEDLRLFLQFIQKNHPSTPLFVSGHSATGGLWLNFFNTPQALDIDVKGVFFVAPNFGPYAQGYQTFKVDPFLRKIKKLILFIYRKTKGKLFKHWYAVYLRYTPENLKQDPLLVEAYTSEMIRALVPRDPDCLIKKLKVPFDLIIGKKDQLLNYKTLAEFCSQSPLFRCLHCYPNLKHLSIVVQLAQCIGENYSAFLEFKKPAPA